ncbi:MAG: alpha/beta hydrolase [Paracoccaceae bacterium]
MARYMESPEGRRIAYDRLEGEGPGVVFLGGFLSDKEGGKAVALEAWARAGGRAFVRFDYSGHGQSSGSFAEGALGDWYEDALAVLQALTEGPQILVGSSMGGWIALLLARAVPERLAGLVTIAAAPDFTEDGMWGRFSEAERREIMERGFLEVPSDYDDKPYPITRRLIEDGRRHLVLRSPLDLPFPVRMLQGTGDAEVPVPLALRLLDHATGPDMALTLVKGVDHRFSSPACLELIARTIDEIAPLNASR